MKKIILIFCACIIVTVCLEPVFTDKEPREYESVVRFHIRANSNGEGDQEVKLAVRDGIVEFAKNVTKDCKSSREAAARLEESFPVMESVADRILAEHGFDYTSRAYLTKERFPEKSYGDVCFPEGIYTAVCLELGEGTGDNFWCVLFPPICLADSCTEQILDDYGVDDFGKNKRYVVKFKLWEGLKRLFSR